MVIDEADFEAVPLRTVRAIEIEQFVEADAQRTAPIFVKQAYYLEPEPVGRKAFGLLEPCSPSRGLQGICKIVLKDREQLSVLDPYQSTMLLSTIYWPDEVRDLGELDLPEPRRRAQARRDRHGQAAGVSAMTGEFEPERYRDEYREALLKVIEAKVDGQPDRGARAGRRDARAHRPHGGAGGERGAGTRQSRRPDRGGAGGQGEGAEVVEGQGVRERRRRGADPGQPRPSRRPRPAAAEDEAAEAAPQRRRKSA